MSDVIDALAKIEVSKETQSYLDLKGIYASFTENYKKLDDLKNFRTDHEKRNFLMRWWHNDKLRDAQLDSSEVQAEFSKAIGQLMVLSIMQSKRLGDQQTQLNKQQGELKVQANGIVEHAKELERQQQVLAEQSEHLKTLMQEYFALKGLTEEGAERLIAIAHEVKATKQGMLEEFATRTTEVEVLCNDVRDKMGALSADVAKQIQASAEEYFAAITAQQKDMGEKFAASESMQREERQALHEALGGSMTLLEQRQVEAHASLDSKHNALDAKVSELCVRLEQQRNLHGERLDAIDGGLADLFEQTAGQADALSRTNASLAVCVQQQKAHQESFENFRQEVLGKLRRMGYISAGLSIAIAGLLTWVAYLLR